MRVDARFFRQKLEEGISAWSQWRWENIHIGVDLQGIDLTHSDLNGIRLDLCDLSRANLYKAKLRESSMLTTKFIQADLRQTEFHHSNLTGTDFTGAMLQGAGFSKADLYQTQFIGADLSGANFISASINQVDLTNAVLDGCEVWAASVWDMEGEPASQRGLIITPRNEPPITVDNLEFAQFIRLLLTGRRLRMVIDTITTHVVLILGRFTLSRKPVLDGVAERLRDNGWIPVVFDWERPSSRNTTETISTLAHLARFVIADITDARSVPQELQRIVPHLPSVPVVPILNNSQSEYGMFDDFRDYATVLDLVVYEDLPDLLSSLEDRVINPATARAAQITAQRDRRRADLGLE